MRKSIWILGLVSMLIVAVAGCKKAEKTPAEERSPEELAAPLEAAAPQPEPATPTGVAGAENAEPQVGMDGSDESAAAQEEEEPPLIERFRAMLVEEGFVAVDIEPLLPDVLGGLREECDALERNRINLVDEDWTSLGILESPEGAKRCLEAYLQLPGADRFRNSYVQTGPYILEVRPSMTSEQQAQIKRLFAELVAQ